jgi:hypothetical protein
LINAEEWMKKWISGENNHIWRMTKLYMVWCILVDLTYGACSYCGLLKMIFMIDQGAIIIEEGDIRLHNSSKGNEG